MSRETWCDCQCHYFHCYECGADREDTARREDPQEKGWVEILGRDYCPACVGKDHHAQTPWEMKEPPIAQVNDQVATAYGERIKAGLISATYRQPPFTTRPGERITFTRTAEKMPE